MLIAEKTKMMQMLLVVVRERRAADIPYVGVRVTMVLHQWTT